MTYAGTKNRTIIFSGCERDPEIILTSEQKKNTEDDFHLPSNRSGGKQAVCGKRRTGKFSEGSRQRLYQVGICTETTITQKMQEDVKGVHLPVLLFSV